MYKNFYLILVDCLLLFFLWVVSTCVFICLIFLIDEFPSLIFMYRVFYFILFKKENTSIFIKIQYNFYLPFSDESIQNSGILTF